MKYILHFLISLSFLLWIPNVRAQTQSTKTVTRAANFDSKVPTLVGKSKNKPTKLKSRIHDSSGRLLPQARQNATIEVNYIGFTSAAQAAFQHAVDIWESTIHSDVVIRIEAKWTAFGFDPSPGALNRLGYAGPTNFYTITGVPFPNSFYPVALTNSLTRVDNSPNLPHISAEFNSDFPFWYFGTDAQPAFDESDFVTTVLHEIGHGLGFLGGSIDGTSIYIDANNVIPLVWSNFVEENDGTAITTYAHNTPDLISALVGDDLFFNGPFTVDNNNGSRPKLYVPNPFKPGSSYSHLDLSPAVQLMEPELDPGDAIHTVTDYELGMLYDMGWAPEPGTAFGPIQVCADDNSMINLANLLFGENEDGIWVINNGSLNPATGFNATAGTFVANGNASGVYIFDYTFPLGISSSVTIELVESSSGTAGAPLSVSPSDATTINLFNQLTNEDAGGTWTINPSSPTPSSGFDASQGTFIPNGNNTGSFSFDYTVSNPPCTEKTTTVIINLVCPTEQDLTGHLNMDIVYESGGYISSDQTIGSIDPTISIEYSAATSISLISNFEVYKGVVFHAFIEGCGI